MRPSRGSLIVSPSLGKIEQNFAFEFWRNPFDMLEQYPLSWRQWQIIAEMQRDRILEGA